MFDPCILAGIDYTRINSHTGDNMPHKILVVDDEPATLKLVSGLLEAENYEVVQASDGLEALQVIQREAPDLVVLDVMMPEINGYDVCYQLHFNKEYHTIPVILLTKREKEIDSRIGERANIDYIPKPIDSTLLLLKVSDLLRQQ